MYCPAPCRSKWCFICGVQLEERHHYSHYKGEGMGGPYGDTCHGPQDPEVLRQLTAEEAEAADNAVRAEMDRLRELHRQLARPAAAAAVGWAGARAAIRGRARAPPKPVPFLPPPNDVIPDVIPGVKVDRYGAPKAPRIERYKRPKLDNNQA